MDRSDGTHKDTEDTTFVQIKEVIRVIRTLSLVTKLSSATRTTRGRVDISLSMMDIKTFKLR
jgi:hypothetical protein